MAQRFTLRSAMRAASFAALALTTNLTFGATPSDWWLDVQMKAHSILIDPATGERSAVMDPLPTPMGLRSPDGTKVAFIGSDPARVQDSHDFDLFVADVDPTQPSSKNNIRRLTTDQQQPSHVHWLPDSAGLVFQAGDQPTQQVWYVSLEADSKPVRWSDGEHRSYDVAVLADGRVAWTVHKGSKRKEVFKDLVFHPAPTSHGKIETVLQDQHISSYSISPDDKTLAWSGLGSLFLVDLETNETREIPLHGIHPQLLNHTAHDMAWRPDGKILAIRCGFLGGIARAFDADPNEPWPRMFAADKIFFLPIEWSPTAEALKVGSTQESFPSPTADDPNAEISPPAGDESHPWWVREVSERSLGLTWVSAKDARERIARHPAPPDMKNEEEEAPRPMPPAPGQPRRNPE